MVDLAAKSYACGWSCPPEKRTAPPSPLRLRDTFLVTSCQAPCVGRDIQARAFYDVLADNELAVRELGDATLKKIALQLTEQLRRD